VVHRLGVDLGYHLPIVHPHVGNEDAGMVSFSSQGQQEGSGAVFGVLGVDLDVQQVVGGAVHGKV
jgi:hypothetical protein